MLATVLFIARVHGNAVFDACNGLNASVVSVSMSANGMLKILTLALFFSFPPGFWMSIHTEPDDLVFAPCPVAVLKPPQRCNVRFVAAFW